MKNYVDVICLNQKNGKIKPLCIVWDDGVKYPIDKIVQVINAASIKSGGMSLRYTCKIGLNFRYLYFSEGKWFIEKFD